MTKLTHFATVDQAVDYFRDELIYTLEDDLERMQGSEAEHYTDGDRATMERRIADLRLIAPRLVLGPAPTAFDANDAETDLPVSPV